MRMYDIIDNKKHGKELSFDEIKFFVNGFTDGSVPDYQASALLMAICLKGMSDSEISNLTLCMAQSGDMNDMSKIDGVSCDSRSHCRKLRSEGCQNERQRSRPHGRYG